MTEEWKKCFEDYEISNFGNCKKGDKIINGSINNRGYKYFQVQRGGKRINKLFHSMVAEQFIGPYPENSEVDHIDINKLNNNVSNLRYVSHAENMKNILNYRHDILEEDKRLRYNLMCKGYYRKKLEEQGKSISYERGNGSIKQRPNGRWKVQYGFNKHNYIKTFDTEEECKNYVNMLKQQLNG
jgi:hypothetical protein